MELHGAFLDEVIAAPEDCWRRAYDSIARQFQAAKLLSDEIVDVVVPAIVADASASAGWFDERWSQVRPSALFNERMGGRFYLPWRVFDFFEALEGRMTHWRGQLLLRSGQEDEGKTRVQPLSTPAGVRWEDVEIEVADAHITIKTPGVQKQMDFVSAGFGERDQRLEVLRLLAGDAANWILSAPPNVSRVRHQSRIG
jgi:hypothetical protein